MNLNLSDEQCMIAEVAARFFADRGSVEKARDADGTVSMALWRETCEIGFITMRVAENRGGTDSGLMDAALVCEAAGCSITPIPLWDGIAAARLLGELESEVADELLQSVADYPLTFDADARLTQLALEGTAIVAMLPDGTTRTLTETNTAAALFEAALAERTLLRAAWLVGAGARAVEIGAAHATERTQFGRPIGSFQGIAFPLVDSITDMEAARLAVWYAVWAIAAGRDDAAAALAMADWWVSDRARVAALRALRTFGGYGLSIEYDIHLYFLAINRTALADGDPAMRLGTIGDRLWAGEITCLPNAGDPGIDMGLGSAAEAFGEDVRRFFNENMTPELRAFTRESMDGHEPDFHRRLAAAGLAYADWPKALGGQGRSAMEMTALGRVFEQFRWSRIAIGTTNMGARMVLQFGSPELRDEVLPKLADGTSISALGFTEPESGSDMFAARTRAVRDADDWLISGQKMFTTVAHVADYVLLLTRTNPEKSKHRGLTIFFVPLSLSGIAIQRLDTMQGERTNITFYDAVRVPDRYRLGEIDGGMAVMAAAMEIEHGGEGYHIHHHSLLEAALTWARTPDAKGARPINDRMVRARLAQAQTHLLLSDLMCRRVTWAGEVGQLTRGSGPMSKLFATECYMVDAADLVALTASQSLTAAPEAIDEIEALQRQSISQTIYGGTSEVHRGIVAEHVLGLPRGQ